MDRVVPFKAGALPPRPRRRPLVANAIISDLAGPAAPFWTDDPKWVARRAIFRARMAAKLRMARRDPLATQESPR